MELPNQKLYTDVFYTCDQRPAQRILKLLINPQAPIAKKTADEVVFRRFQGEGVEFYSLLERVRLKRKKRFLFTLTNL